MVNYKIEQTNIYLPAPFETHLPFLLITYSKQHFSPLSPFANSSTWIFSPFFRAISMSFFFAEQSAEYLHMLLSCQNESFVDVDPYRSTARAKATKPVVVATSLRELSLCARGRQKRMTAMAARTTRRWRLAMRWPGISLWMWDMEIKAGGSRKFGEGWRGWKGKGGGEWFTHAKEGNA